LLLGVIEHAIEHAIAVWQEAEEVPHG
jgi:hypothetical protein